MSKTLTLGTINVDTMVFQSPFSSKHFYVVRKEPMDTLEFLKKYCVGDVDCKQATGLNFDFEDKDFYMMYVADCFDPPIAIVRASDESEAWDIFANELPWARLNDEEIAEKEKDGFGELVAYSDQGHAYWTENLHCRLIKLHRIEV